MRKNYVRGQSFIVCFVSSLVNGITLLIRLGWAIYTSLGPKAAAFDTCLELFVDLVQVLYRFSELNSIVFYTVRQCDKKGSNFTHGVDIS